MTPEEIASETAQRIQQADEDALLAAEAFALGLGDEYIQQRQADIRRRLNERFANTNRGSG